MFGRQNRDETRTAPDRNDRNDRSTTIIGNGASFNGVVRVNGSLRIDGEVEGQIQVTEVVTVGASGVVKAEIQASSAIVGGRIKGRIWAKEKIVLQRGARLEGDVRAAVFKIEDGAFFQGNCAMGEAGKPGAADAPRDPGAQGRNLQVVG